MLDAESIKHFLIEQPFETHREVSTKIITRGPVFCGAKADGAG